MVKVIKELEHLNLIESCPSPDSRIKLLKKLKIKKINHFENFSYGFTWQW